MFLRGSGRQSVRKGQMGRRPLRREKAKPLWRQTLRSRVALFERMGSRKRREGRSKENDFGFI
jgi:hypothetical protein